MKFETKFGERNLEVQIGGLAEEASGCCLVKYGETSILNTCQLGQVREEMDFFPLSCHYEERYYAAGKIWAQDLSGERVGRQPKRF